MSKSQSDMIYGLLQQSTFVFKGTIKRLKAATFGAVRATEQTMIVHVDEVLHSRGALDLPEADVTVRTDKLEKARMGQRAVFFTSSWLYGTGIAVTEVARISNVDVALLKKQIRNSLRRIVDDELQRRIVKADLIIVGRVLRTRRAPDRLRGGHLVDQDCDLWIASIKVESIAKGHSSLKRVTVLFPNSYHPAWRSSPKYHEGQEGVWLLQKGQREKAGILYGVPGFTALDPKDFQTKGQLRRIRKLVKRGR